MKDNTLKDSTGNSLDIYSNKVYELADEYINTLDNPDDIKGLNKGLFTGMIKYIYINCFKDNKPNYDDIELLDSIFGIYTSLCYKYNKRPTILNFSLFSGIDRDTISDWSNGVYRNGNGDKLGSLHLRTAKKWLRECESSLVDGAIEQNGIGCIFALKANYGYTETAPAQVPYSGDIHKSIEQIAQEHSVNGALEDKQSVVDMPTAEF